MNGSLVFLISQDGRVYIVDYEILNDVPHYGTLNKKLERRYACPASGLFYEFLSCSSNIPRA